MHTLSFFLRALYPASQRDRPAFLLSVYRGAYHRCPIGTWNDFDGVFLTHQSVENNPTRVAVGITRGQ